MKSLCDFGVEVWSGSDLDDLLVATLNRAVALKKVNSVGVVVSENLHLNVAWSLNGLFNEDGRVAKRTFSFSHSRLKRVDKLNARVDATHTTSTTTGDCLDEERKLHVFGFGEQLVEVCRRAGRSQRWNASATGGVESIDLVTGHLENIGCGPNEGDSISVTRACQIRVLGKETVTGVDRVGAGFLCDTDNLFDAQIRANRVSLFANQVRFVSFEAVLRVAVLIWENCDG